MDISVVIPTYNKAAYLELTLASLMCQSCEPACYEVIVIDDGSSDRTGKILEQFARQHWQFHAITQQHAGRSAARNTGIRVARGKIVLFLDDDCLCQRTLLQTHRSHHHAVGNTVVIGVGWDVIAHLQISREQGRQNLETCLRRMPFMATDTQAVMHVIERAVADLPTTINLLTAEDIVHHPEKIDALAIALPTSEERDYFQRIAQSRCRCPWLFFITRNVSVTRTLLLEVGLFDERFQGWGEEDQELGYRLFRAGATFDATMEAAVYHQLHPYHERSDKEFLRNYLRFAEKYHRPEIYLRAQLIQHLLSRQAYEQVVERIEAGRVSEQELAAMKAYYDRFRQHVSEEGEGEGASGTNLKMGHNGSNGDDTSVRIQHLATVHELPLPILV